MIKLSDLSNTYPQYKTTRYHLDNYEQQPDFRYLVQNLGAVEKYWLYNDFDKAYGKMKELGRNGKGSYILEPTCIAKEWKMRRIFRCFEGDVYHDGNNGDILLHVKFYVEAGEWMNFSEEIDD